MIDKTLETLMNETIDGTASPEDTARVEAAVAADAEARALFEDLQRLEGLLQSVPLAEPPAELKKGVLRRIDAISRPVASPAPGHAGEDRFRFRDLFARFRPAYGLSFAGGLAAGIAVIALLSPPSALEDGGLTGVMAPQEAFQSLPVADRVTFDTGGIHGTLETRFSPGFVISRVAVNAPGDVEIVAAFDGSLRPVGFRRQEPETGEVAIGADEARLHQHGRNTFWLIFEEGSKPPSDLHFRVYSGDLLFERSLRTTTGNP
jgi:hypothetical protein